MSESQDIWSSLSLSARTPTQDWLGPNLCSWMNSLPTDYRDVLLRHNGGVAPSGRYSFTVDIPCRGERGNRPSVESAVDRLLPIQPNAEKHSMDDLVECNAYVHDVGSVPPDAIAIASCDSSLVCLSVRPRDFGAVYYWEYYAEYLWHKEFFQERRRQVLARHTDAEAILGNPRRFEFAALFRELQWARLVRLADSFGRWEAQLRDERVPRSTL